MRSNSAFASLAVMLVLAAMVTCQTFTVDYSQNNLAYTSTDSIVAASLSTLNPRLPSMFPVRTIVSGLFNNYGLIGPYGPLGVYGHIGSNQCVPAKMVSGNRWTMFEKFLTVDGGSVAMDGPLGSQGPLNPDIYTGRQEPGQSLYETDPFSKHLRGLGLWSIVGAIGPLGALGPLGPLGIRGGHGFTADSNGNFLNASGQVVRQITVNYDGRSSRTYNLVEKYTDTYASANPSILDTSFMIIGNVSSGNSKFTFLSAENQIVSIVVVAEGADDQFSLGLYDQSGRLIGQSKADKLTQTIQIKVVAGQKLTAAVGGSPSSQSFRLIVVGSTQYLNMNNISGNHILPYYKSASA